MDEVDNERLARLHRFGVPPPIAEWDGWMCPTIDEVRQLQSLMAQEEARDRDRPQPEASTIRRGFDAPNWLLVGQHGMVEYLSRRPQLDATQYARQHPVIIPHYAELDAAPATTSAADDNSLASLIATSASAPVDLTMFDVVGASGDGDDASHTPPPTQ
jgi:hypothetical protein